MSDELFGSARADAIESAIRSDALTSEQFASLLSKSASGRLESMAGRANELTVRHFGRTIQLYTPLYLSNYCDNACAYCGFNAGNAIRRRRLTPDEVGREAASIAATGIKHVLVLTGESRSESPVSYIRSCAEILRTYFQSISIEVYALTQEEYGELIAAGVDGLTIYQETCNEAVYRKVHPSGPKADYRFRLDAPERASLAGMRTVNIGVLYGLDDWRRETFLMGLHARYIQDAYPDVDVAASIPRMRPHAGSFRAPHAVPDAAIVQAIAALRIFLPRLGITVSTRESAAFRENIVPLGVTRMSAGSTTSVGGHAAREARTPDGASCQFQISDERSVADIKEMLASKGYQPVLKDWMQL